MFVGRENELEAMERLYRKGGFQMLVLYGRRRIGKTTLLKRFSANKPTIFFTAKEQSSSLNLKEFSQTLFQFFNPASALTAFGSWAAAFTFLAEQTRNVDRPVLLVFDEFPYAATTDPSLPSTLQVAIDHELLLSNVLVVLSGSNEGFMESKVLGSKSPLYGRRTAQMKLQPFDYCEAAAMVSAENHPDELLRYYATFGGTPYYLAQIDSSASYTENVEELLFSKSGILYEEPLMLSRQELREPSLYNSILYAVAAGATKPKRIAEASGVEASTAGKYLKTLEDLGLVIRDVPFGDDPQRSKKGLYRINDPFFAYWYRFVGPNMGAIEAGAGPAVARKRAQGEALSAYEGKLFESVCLQWLQRVNRREGLPFLATAFGSWWGANPAKREQTDIDVVAADAQDKAILLGECKWRNDFDESAALQSLSEREGLIKGYEHSWLYLFTKRPTSKGTQAKAGGRVRLVDAEAIYEG